jgi:hypothetical protein
MRTKVAKYLKQKGYSDGGPTTQCLVLFWSIFIAWAAAYVYTVYYGTVFGAFMYALMATYLGGFGHNWVHIPKYKFHAYLSLDTIGFASDHWFRQHNLQHHMYTNSPWDNHLHGTDPFLITDPTFERNWF